MESERSREGNDPNEMKARVIDKTAYGQTMTAGKPFTRRFDRFDYGDLPR
jgi:hypothetical protein